MLSVVSLRPFVEPATPPFVALSDMQQEYQAKPRALAICGIGGGLGNGRKPRRNRKATSRGAPFFGQARNEVATSVVSGVSAQAIETAAWVAATSPRSPNNGNSADG